MYEGYRLKIDGSVLPNSYIQKGTYSLKEQKRVAEIWKDANLVEHEVTTGESKAEISFSIRQHNLTEHEELSRLLRKEHDITVEYWSDLKGNYATGTFRRSDIAYRHLTADGENITYDAASVTLTED